MNPAARAFDFRIRYGDSAYFDADDTFEAAPLSNAVGSSTSTVSTATIEKAKADDPRELRKQIAALKAQLAKPANVITPQRTVETKTVERFVLKDGHLARAEKLVEQIGAVVERAKPLLEQLEAQRLMITAAIEKAHAPALAAPETRRPVPLRPAPAPTPSRPVAPSGDVTVGNSGLRRMLIALAQRNGLNRRQLGVRAGLSSRSGTFDTYLSRGRTNGWIGGSKDAIEITASGLQALGAYDPLPEGRALLNHWLGELGESGAARILRALAAVYPRTLSRQALGEAAELSDRSGTFDTYLSRLRTLELIQGRGELKASEELFD